MAHPAFDHADFLGAALALAAQHGPQAVTVAAVTERLGAPTGSFYHRFKSRDVLLGELWLNTVLDFQRGIAAALAARDGLAAALHTPHWVRGNLDAARILLLHHRDDFVQGEWPAPLRERVAEHVARSGAALRQFACDSFGQAGDEELRRVQFVVAEVPVAAVSQHLRRREAPPPLVDELIRTTYRAVMRRRQRT